MTKHKHADLIAEFARIAQFDDKPHLHFQVKRHDWKWVDCTYNPSWSNDHNYRLKPKKIVVNGVEVPIPVKSYAELVGNDFYYLVVPVLPARYITCPNYKSVVEPLIPLGVVFKTEEDCKQFVQALFSYTSQL